MSYRTIAVHADLSRHAPERFAVAGALAQAFDACLIGAAATGLSALVYPSEQAMVPRAAARSGAYGVRDPAPG